MKNRFKVAMSRAREFKSSVEENTEICIWREEDGSVTIFVSTFQCGDFRWNSND